jgi:hypothetical protein
MYCSDRGLFCFKLVERNGELVPLDISVRYTAITIIGLCRAEEFGYSSPWLLPHLIDRLSANLQPAIGLGDLALVFWASCMGDPEHARHLLPTMMDRWAEDAGRRNGSLETMQLAWLVSGLCTYRNVCGDDPSAEALLQSAVDELLTEHYNRESHLFYHCARTARSLRRRLVSDICHFAEQIYGIQALTTYARSTGQRFLEEYARETAAVLIRNQTIGGGWAWLYHVPSGKPIDIYPIYSVHQLGMAPMSLLPLVSDAKDPVSRAVRNGIEWAFGQNELKRSLVNGAQGVIWRSIKPEFLPRQQQLLRKSLSTIGLTSACEWPWLRSRRFQIDRECRPYELGWLLYALTPPAC